MFDQYSFSYISRLELLWGDREASAGLITKDSRIGFVTILRKSKVYHLSDRSPFGNAKTELRVRVSGFPLRLCIAIEDIIPRYSHGF